MYYEEDRIPFDEPDHKPTTKETEHDNAAPSTPDSAKLPTSRPSHQATDAR
ncbi:hypothetical protein ACFFNY_23815 [Paenibacillus hodogayensis]|uniref:Multidrug transporter n=1 Tax=Paenibacillus hodogayensis TaxID=279208 RepID=A0ABV5W200_9BACL